MSLDSLSIATQGLLSGASDVISVQGFIDTGTPPPEPTPSPSRGGVGGSSIGRVQRFRVKYVPKYAKPEVLEKKVVKAIAKRLRIKRVDASYLADWAKRTLVALPEFAPVARIATDTAIREVEPGDVAKILAFWKAVEQYAIEMAEEDELLLLLT